MYNREEIRRSWLDNLANFQKRITQERLQRADAAIKPPVRIETVLPQVPEFPRREDEPHKTGEFDMSFLKPDEEPEHQYLTVVGGCNGSPLSITVDTNGEGWVARGSADTSDPDHDFFVVSGTDNLTPADLATDTDGSDWTPI